MAQGKQKTTEEFISEAKAVHGDKYDYSSSFYQNARTKVSIVCPTHGVFEQQPDKHINGKNGCGKCHLESSRTTQEGFIKQVSEIHNNRYDYSLTKYVTARDFITIICPIHGEFHQKANWHINGRGCPICNYSKGEIKIEKYLIENNIEFLPQHKFDDCFNKNKLPFDFYLPTLNILIEFDGKQHFEPIKFFGGIKHLKETQYNDKIKNKYCEEKNINLIRIRHDDNITEKLKNNLF